MTELVQKIATEIQKHGGRVFLVGGTVRDHVLGLKSSDLDLEVFGLPLDQIEKIITPFGTINHIGKQFAILQLTTYNLQREPTYNLQLEIAVPRKETKTSPGHRGFTVEPDPTLSPEQAARRRDFTINAMLLDPLTNELIDPFGGQADLKQLTLRMVDAVTFVEDPLRVLRAFQLAARFELRAEPTTLKLLKSMVPSVDELPVSRFAPEWKKLFLHTQHPSHGLIVVQETGYFGHTFPDLNQRSSDSFLAVDEAAALTAQYHSDTDEQLVIMLAVWLYTINPAGGNGAEIAQRWLTTQGFSKSMVASVTALVRQLTLRQNLEELEKDGPLSAGTIRKIVNQLAPATPMQFLTVQEAIARAHGSIKREESFAPRTWWPKKLRVLGLEAGPNPIIRGQDLLDLGWSAGNQIGEVIAAAEMYAENTGADRQKILQRIREAGSAEQALKVLIEKK